LYTSLQNVQAPRGALAKDIASWLCNRQHGKENVIKPNIYLHSKIFKTKVAIGSPEFYKLRLHVYPTPKMWNNLRQSRSFAVASSAIRNTLHLDIYRISLYTLFAPTQNMFITRYYTQRLKKQTKIVFCYNFVEFSPTLIIFGKKWPRQ